MTRKRIQNLRPSVDVAVAMLKFKWSWRRTFHFRSVADEKSEVRYVGDTVWPTNPETLRYLESETPASLLDCNSSQRSHISKLSELSGHANKKKNGFHVGQKNRWLVRKEQEATAVWIWWRYEEKGIWRLQGMLCEIVYTSAAFAPHLKRNQERSYGA